MRFLRGLGNVPLAALSLCAPGARAPITCRGLQHRARLPATQTRRPALGTSPSWTQSPQAGSLGAVRVLKPSPPSRAGATLAAEMLKTLGSCPCPAPGLQRLCALRGRCPGSGRCAPANLGRLAQSAPRDGLVIPWGVWLAVGCSAGEGERWHCPCRPTGPIPNLGLPAPRGEGRGKEGCLAAAAISPAAASLEPEMLRGAPGRSS